VIPKLILLASLCCFWWLIKKDIARRPGISKAIWIPTLWVAIQTSRPLSMWLDFGGADDTLEGSPLDRLFYFGMIFAAFVVLVRRRLAWSRTIADNWPIVLFYTFFLISVTWAPAPFVSFKRWFKEVGNILIALVILTEVNPQQAFRAVFVRCAYVWIPLSVIFLRYFPDLGRRYLRSGALEVVGVTTQKNSLGILVVVCGLALIWDWLEQKREGNKQTRIERWLPVIFFVMGSYLLYLCDSKTSILCLILGGLILSASRLPVLRQRIGALGFIAITAIIGFFALDWMLGIKEPLLKLMGRDATFTGRTEVWRELLALKTDPWLGTGFCSIWSDQQLLAKLPNWVGKSAHNGFLETYIDGGYVGLFFLGVMFLAVAIRLHRHLATGENYALIRFAVFVALLVGSLSESHIGRMSPLSFMFLLAAIGFAQIYAIAVPVKPALAGKAYRSTLDEAEPLSNAGPIL
jgi:exopolysaccharide production protein ExoQ